MKKKKELRLQEYLFVLLLAQLNVHRRKKGQKMLTIEVMIYLARVTLCIIQKRLFVLRDELHINIVALCTFYTILAR